MVVQLQHDFNSIFSEAILTQDLVRKCIEQSKPDTHNFFQKNIMEHMTSVGLVGTSSSNLIHMTD